MTELSHKFADLQEVSEKGIITGYASRFGEVDQGGDKVAVGAFQASLKLRMPKMLRDHNPSKLIGRWTEVQEDANGLRMVGQINLETEGGKEAYALARDGALDGLSIGYRTKKAYRTKGGIRVLAEVDLFEVSLVTFPMQETAVIDGVKHSGDEITDIKRTIEVALGKSGFGLSRSETALAAKAAADALKCEREAALSDDQAALLELLGQIDPLAALKLKLEMNDGN